MLEPQKEKLNKELIKSKFEKSAKTYDKNASPQTKMAKTLLDLILKKHPEKNFENILEIGSYTGIFTKELIKNLDFENYLALDVVDSFSYIKDLNPKISFKNMDIENFETKEKFDLIAANASLQWCEDFDKTLLKLLSFKKESGLLAFSIFDKDNLFEIKNAFNVGLNYKNEDEILVLLNSKKIKSTTIKKEKITLEFKNPREILRHLKLTGVNSLNKKEKMPYKKIKQGMKILEEEYKNKLTYSILYVII